ncbi:MAG: anthranilate synthase component I family protein [Parvibaculales bacterium]
MPDNAPDLLFYADAAGGLIAETRWVSPEAVFAPHADTPHALWLDSSHDAHAAARASYIATCPHQIISGAPEHARRHFEAADTALASGAGLWQDLPPEIDAQVPSFRGGLAGFFGYDLARGLHPMPDNINRNAHDDLGLPGLTLGLYATVLAFDMRARRAFIIATGLPETDPKARRRQAENDIADWQNRLDRLAENHRRAESPRPAAFSDAPLRAAHAPQSNFTAQDFRETVTQVVERILDGEIFQANIAQRFHGRLDPADSAFAYYRRMRQFSPAPFSAFATYDNWSLASASPERFLHCAHGTLESRPIKGTRPRGATPARDKEIAADLLASGKDRAENTMIVDLLRNDMAKSCRDGSIEVPELCALEKFSNVHHLVSTIRGTLRADTTPLAALRDCFPGGSITGAPKIQAMGVIAELEPHARGPYCGAMGYIGFDGQMDTNILIRTAVIKGHDVYFHAGGGMVADSAADAEYNETLDKASGLIAALCGTPAGARSA